jgi:7-carboxy-7-deazaguanine synthase (Cx14CxxC type)
MTYAVKEIFYTLQGEGANMGRPAVFIRFSGCNLWSGREKDRATAVCRFCDTDFVGGRRYHLDELADEAAALWPKDHAYPFVVLTGGEPALQVDRALVHALKRRDFQVAIETNGTIEIPPMGIDWTCVSPKAGTVLRVTTAEEIKLVFPQVGLMPDDLRPLQAFHYWLSPMDGPSVAENTQAAIEYCKANPEWRLAIQAHKVWSVR